MLILWRVFEHCNLSCSFCGYSKHLPQPRAVADANTVLKFGSILGEYAKEYQRCVTVSWLGGEPLLWPELPRISATFHNAFGLRLSVTTNGLPLEDREVRTSLIQDYDQVTVSVDGIGSFHDECRGLPGLFERVRNAVIELRKEADAAKRALKITVNTILMRGNVAGFEGLCREVAAWGVSELTFNQLGGNDRPEFYPANRLLPQQADVFAAALPDVRTRMSKIELTIHGGERYLERISATTRGVRLPIDDCGPGQTFLFIDERGRIAPCSFTANEYGIHMDEIQNPHDFANLPERFQQLRLRRAEACNDCHSTQLFQKFALPMFPSLNSER
jgi:MoaA/NifB/PqqE/SkfB family radical SAM enzyme